MPVTRSQARSTTANAPTPFSSAAPQTAAPAQGGKKCSCVGGWVSPQMRWVLDTSTEVYLDMLDSEIHLMVPSLDEDSLPTYLEFGLCGVPDSLLLSLRTKTALRSFLYGYVFVLNSALKVIQLSGQVPTVAAVAEEAKWCDPSTLLVRTTANAAHYARYIELGGTVEMAVEGMLKNALTALQDGDGDFFDAHGGHPPAYVVGSSGRERGEHGLFREKDWRRAWKGCLGPTRAVPREWDGGWWEEEEAEEWEAVFVRAMKEGKVSHEGEEEEELRRWYL